jgi:hypothetical protein
MNFRDLLERLAEMFPKQDYQSRLERYINARQPKSASEVEHWQKQFETQEFKGLSL